jgi:hypothetical protein
VRVDAPISSTNGDEAARPRAKLLDHLPSMPQFNRRHAVQQFDGVHLDIEPQPRAGLSLMPHELSIPDDSYNDVSAGARAPASP